MNSSYGICGKLSMIKVLEDFQKFRAHSLSPEEIIKIFERALNESDLTWLLNVPGQDNLVTEITGSSEQVEREDHVTAITESGSREDHVTEITRL